MTVIAVAQLEPRLGDLPGNLERSVQAIRRAHAAGAEIIVLPELASSGYMFASRAEAYAASEVAGAGPVTTAWRALADELDVIVVAGFPERDGERLYNAAFMAVPHLGTTVYRKVHLWDEEALYFEPGDLGFPVVPTRHGRLGMLICYDGWFPESYRTLALAGADVVCVPTNWVPIPGQRAEASAMAVTLSMAAAHSNGLVIAAAARVGGERGQDFIGQSTIIDHTGWPVAGPADATGITQLLADVDISQIRRSRSWGNFNNPVRDRRPDQYQGLG
ncbi:nitrilase family protein [Kineococcus sp. NBC_00420]|uniref:nitrilase family protein n=1 Tax=Kineococcus sp. NBC_00420 TaxID=2903564 RepID=UPI002E20B368